MRTEWGDLDDGGRADFDAMSESQRHSHSLKRSRLALADSPGPTEGAIATVPLPAGVADNEVGQAAVVVRARWLARAPAATR